MAMVYPPGASDPIHRHNAYAFLYVLEGSVAMRVQGGKEITLTPGETFYEGPNDIHTVAQLRESTSSDDCRRFVPPGTDQSGEVNQHLLKNLPFGSASSFQIATRALYDQVQEFRLGLFYQRTSASLIRKLTR